MDTIARSTDGGQGLGTRVWTEGSGEIMKILSHAIFTLCLLESVVD